MRFFLHLESNQGFISRSDAERALKICVLNRSFIAFCWAIFSKVSIKILNIYINVLLNNSAKKIAK